MDPEANRFLTGSETRFCIQFLFFLGTKMRFQAPLLLLLLIFFLASYVTYLALDSHPLLKLSVGNIWSALDKSKSWITSH